MGPWATLRRHRWAIVAVGAVALAIVAGAAVSRHFSSAVLVPDRSGWPEDIEVEAVRSGRIVLERTEETGRPGLYGLDWRAGHAIAGPILAESDDTVTRRLERVNGYLPAETEVAIDTSVYSGDPRQARGLPFSPVDVRGELGAMPAWLIPARSSTWAIVVHGINDDPQVGLRMAPELHRLGFPSLLITYREDLGAPESPDGYHHMGLTEWRDLEAAARYALDHGARELLLIGYSMGGSLVTQFMQNSNLAQRTAGLILDAPALDWPAILEFNSEEMGLPGFLAAPVKWAIGTRIDADWSSLNALEHTDDLDLPILLFHGTEDDVVPIATSDELARELPQRVTYYRVREAGHTQAWNVDPNRYERRVRDFLLQTGLKPERARPESGSNE